VCGIGAPYVLVPWLTFSDGKMGPNSGDRDDDARAPYWVKFLAWVAVFAFVASYFFTCYFFDVLGMVYDFPHMTWNLKPSAVMGNRITRASNIPLVMYPFAWIFFNTYFACSVVFIRIMTTSLYALPKVVTEPAAALAAALIFSWAEIEGATLEALRDFFRYEHAISKPEMVVVYATYFVVSFPMLARMDEKGREWSLSYAVTNAAAAAMVSFVLLDLTSQFVVTSWQGHLSP